MSITPAVLAMLAAAGCGPEVAGTGGVVLDDAGRLVAVLAWCESFGAPATLVLYPARSDGSVGDPLLRLTRTGAAPDANHAEVPLAEPGPTWQSDRALPALEDGQSYEVRVWDGTGERRLASFPFTIAELRTVDPARPILTKRYAGGGRYESSFAGAQEFRQAAAADCGG
ncbi:hypothetical protein [Catellatospora chokoriensis]|uniref:Uncharacterized protein n=1 Tax=Catellatospora chokoriensis TaxID=310353 RepID=A0A8J3KCD2_9ACTN|nr:hypothetical protein [Catellatospora chokoriensis]GIF94188.1 hypothetical protein Cch02nite_76320 [Catellatospora chokoriensis]